MTSGRSALTWTGMESATRCLQLLVPTGGVVELRVLVPSNYGKDTVHSGYFDEPAKLLAAAAGLDDRATAIYITLNPINPALLARANNRLVASPKRATSDDDITRRRHLLIDVDPVRPSGISATDEEKALAVARAAEIAAYLTLRGFPEPLVADSGNGGHLVYAIDLPPDDGGLVASVLRGLAFVFDSERVTVDQTVSNPARLTKLYGTWVRKGDSTEDRPHRRSAILSAPTELVVVSEERLRDVATLVPPEPPSSAKRSHSKHDGIDVDRLLAERSIEVARTAPWGSGQKWVLRTCPFNSAHTDCSAFVVQFANGAVAAGCHHSGCKGKSWRDLAALLGVGGQGSVGFIGSVAPDGSVGGELPEPQPLPKDLPPVAPFDYELVPRRLRPWVRDIAERMQCAPEYLLVAILVALATLIGRKIAIRPKRFDVWQVVANLWGAIIGRPSAMKTPVLDAVLEPLRQLETEACREHSDLMREFEAAKLVADERKRKLAEELKSAVAHGDDGADIAQQIAEVTVERPRARRYIVNDPTVEKLGEILNENSNGVLLFRDELPGFLVALDKKGQESARAFYLESWNGQNPFTYDRIGRGTLHIECAIISILGGIQPGPLRRYLTGSAFSGEHDDGMLQRFQVIVYPDPIQTWENHDRWPDAEAKAEAFAVFHELAQLDACAVGAERDADDERALPYLRFTSEAQPVFDAWREQLELRLRSCVESEAFESLLGKYRKLVPALALILHLVDEGRGAVGLDALKRAIACAAFFESHSQRVYADVQAPEIIGACTIGKRLLAAKLPDEFTAGMVQQKGWTGLSDHDAVVSALGVLVEFGWIVHVPQPTPRPAGGRPIARYRVNPKIYIFDSNGQPRSAPAAADRASANEAENARPPADGTDETDETVAGAQRSDSVFNGTGVPDETYETDESPSPSEPIADADSVPSVSSVSSVGEGASDTRDDAAVDPPPLRTGELFDTREVDYD